MLKKSTDKRDVSLSEGLLYHQAQVAFRFTLLQGIAIGLKLMYLRQGIPEQVYQWMKPEQGREHFHEQQVQGMAFFYMRYFVPQYLSFLFGA